MKILFAAAAMLAAGTIYAQSKVEVNLEFVQMEEEAFSDFITANKSKLENWYKKDGTGEFIVSGPEAKRIKDELVSITGLQVEPSNIQFVADKKTGTAIRKGGILFKAPSSRTRYKTYRIHIKSALIYEISSIGYIEEYYLSSTNDENIKKLFVIATKPGASYYYAFMVDNNGTAEAEKHKLLRFRPDPDVIFSSDGINIAYRFDWKTLYSAQDNTPLYEYDGMFFLYSNK